MPKKQTSQEPSSQSQETAPASVPMLPALVGTTAKELAASFVPAISNLLQHLPPDLATFLNKRFVYPHNNPQPQMPGMMEQKSLEVAWIKVINPLTQNKVFQGRKLFDGTILGKTVLFDPESSEQGFPFIVLGGWEERVLGTWDPKKGMDTRCAFRDGVVPCVVNEWGATECKPCRHDSRNRPKYDKDPAAKTDRCKKKMNMIGIGGEFEAIYVIQVSGPAIVDFYSKGIVKQLSEAGGAGLPWYSKAFMLRTVQDGQFWTWQLDDILNTVTPPGYKEFADATLWPGLAPEQVALTMEVLKQLQVMAFKYIKERQEAGRESYRKQMETGEKVTAPPEGEDGPSGDTTGLD